MHDRNCYIFKTIGLDIAGLGKWSWHSRNWKVFLTNTTEWSNKNHSIYGLGLCVEWSLGLSLSDRITVAAKWLLYLCLAWHMHQVTLPGPTLLVGLLWFNSHLGKRRTGNSEPFQDHICHIFKRYVSAQNMNPCVLLQRACRGAALLAC